jgi:uncharacterized protein with NRDE domain
MNSTAAPRNTHTGGLTHRILLAVGIYRPAVPGWRYIVAGGLRRLLISGMLSCRPRSPVHAVTEFLNSTASPVDYLNDIDSAKYAGFNLLVSDGTTLACLSNRADGVRILAPGIYGLSNALLDSPWHKVVRSKAALEALIRNGKVNETELFRLLDDRQKAPVDEVEKEHLPFETAHAISAAFIVLPDYGTRSSSVALLDAAGAWRLSERRFDAAGKRAGDSAFAITP